jgi:hypothetical protein
MASADSLLQQSKNNIRRLGLSAIPFTESPTGFDDTTQLDRTFTGRENELSQVFNLFQGLDRRRILIYGRIGIGKSAFLLEALATLKKDSPKRLFTYTSLPAELDLATAALIALAQELPDDDWAQNTLHQMGIPTAKANELPRRKRTGYQNQKRVSCSSLCNFRYSLPWFLTYLAIIPSSPCFPTVLAK